MKKITSLFTSFVLVGILLITQIGTFSIEASAASTSTISITGKENYDYANQVLKKINAERKKLGIAELKMDSVLLEAAMQRATEASVLFSHTRPNNSKFSTSCDWRISIGENIAVGQKTPDSVVSAWFNSGGHYNNIINSKFKSVGIGCFIANDGTYYWCQVFDAGTPRTVSKSGTVSKTKKVNAVSENLKLSSTVGTNNFNDNSTSKKTTMSVYNTNKGFTSSKQKINNSSFNFKSSNTSVATVSSSGEITVVGGGTATITATVKNGTAKTTQTIKSELSMPKVTLKSAYSSTDSAIRINWNKAANVDGYVVYKYNTSTKVYDNIGKVANNTSNTYRDANLKSATAYKYKIKAYKNKDGKTLWSEYSNVVECVTKPAKPVMKTSFTATTNTIKINWNKVSNCDGYRVFRYNTTKKAWESVTTIKNPSTLTFTDKNRSSGVQYKYRIQAYKKINNVNYWSDCSNAIETATKPNKVTMGGTSKTSTAIRINWNKLNCDGYQIYRLNPGTNSYIKTATINNASTTTLRQSGLKKNSTYKYKIRAFKKTANGTYVYGDFSSVKSVTTNK